MCLTLEMACFQAGRPCCLRSPLKCIARPSDRLDRESLLKSPQDLNKGYVGVVFGGGGVAAEEILSQLVPFSKSGSSSSGCSSSMASFLF